MKRCVSEEDLALYAGGDLENPGVAAHIQECMDGECRACRQALADFQLAGRLFAVGFADPAEEELRAVHLRVSERRNARAVRIPWKRMAAVAASLALAGSVWLHRPDGGTKAGSRLTIGRRTPSFPTPAAKVVHQRGRRTAIKPGIRSVVFKTDENGRPELKVATADPNVVVVLAMGGDNHAN